MNRIWTKILALFLFFLLPTPILAQGPATFTFEDFGIRHDSKAAGTTASLFFDFNVPRRWEESPPTINLHFSHSTLLLGDHSQMSALYNDVPLADVRLTPKNAADGRLQINVPPTALKPGRHRLKLIFYQRLHPDRCADLDAPPALWTVIHKDSTISFEPGPSTPDLAWFPEPFAVYGRPALESIPVTLALPSQPAEAELHAAGLVIAKLGQLAGARNLDLSISLGNTPAQGHAIVIARADRLVELLPDDAGLPLPFNAAQFSNLAGQPIPPGEGVIQLATRAAESGLLLLSGGSDLALARAALALADDASLRLMSGRFALIKETPAPVYPPETIEPATTLEGLTGSGNRRAEGITIEELPYCFRLPPNAQVGPEAALDLRYTHSPSLRAERSSLTVMLNTATLTSVPLDGREAGPGRLIVPIPAHELIDGYNCLRFVFTLRLHQDQCVVEHGGEAWAEILGASPVNLPYTLTEEKQWLPDLAQYPYPFNLDSDLADTAIVLPNSATAAEIRGALLLAARLGNEARHPTLRLTLKSAAAWDNQTDPARHLILMGEADRNPVVGQLDSTLVELSGQNEAALGARRALLMSRQNGAAIAVAELINSPWAAGRGVLRLSGRGEALARAVELFSANRAEEALSGNIVTVTEAGAVRSVDTLSRPKRPAKIEVTESGEVVVNEAENPATIRWFLVGGGLLLGLILLAAGGLVARDILRRRQHEYARN